jgi:FkbM family methyltransferase
MRHFFNTLGQIANSDSVGFVQGASRHLSWQARKIFDGFPCELSLSKSRLYVDHANSVAALVNAMGPYDFNNMSFLQLTLRLFGGVFVDVGANIGAYTLLASEIPSCLVLSIEPHPRAYRLLTENIRRNRRNNVQSFNVALSNQNGSCSFTDGRDLAVNHVASSREPASHSLTVPSRTLQSLCRETGITPDFIKIDVEGHEGAVLDGFGEFAPAARVIWIEGGERPAIRQKLRDAGYLGPYYVHFKVKRLKVTPVSRAEDAVYLQSGALLDLERTGFTAETEIAPRTRSSTKLTSLGAGGPQFR